MTTKAYVIAVMLVCQISSLFAQEQLPGGVGGLLAWHVAVHPFDDTSNASKFPLPLLNNRPNAPMDGEWLMNFNPSVVLSPTSGAIELDFSMFDISQSTIWVVFHLADTTGEHPIWHFEKNDSTNLIFTECYLLDIEKDRQVNSGVGNSVHPFISTYFQHKKKAGYKAFSQRFYLGGDVVYDKKPLMPFVGKLAEIIVYDRVLSMKDMQKVGTYLALKYGIPLSQKYEPTSYIGAENTILWDAVLNKAFKYNISGIGRDDKSKLYPKQSCCVYEPGLLTIGFGQLATDNQSNNAVVADQNFWIWSDNGKDLEIMDEDESLPRKSLRQWKMTITGTEKKVPTTLQLDGKQFENQPKANECWWLCIDRSNTGLFMSGQTYFKRPDSISPEGKISFQHVEWDSDGNGYDHFTVGIGPKMFAKIDLTLPKCSTATPGIMRIAVEGGRGPYTIWLNGKKTNLKWEVNDNAWYEVQGVQAGTYYLKVADADHLTYNQTLYVQSDDAPISGLANRYVLPENRPLQLDANLSHLEGARFQWVGPEGFSAYTSDVEITLPGTYILTIEKDGCFSQQEIEIKQPPPSLIKEISIAPNPTAQNASFSAEIRLYQDAELKVSIFSPSGQCLKEKVFQGDNYYKWDEWAAFPAGAYPIVFRCGLSVKTLTLIVD